MSEERWLAPDRSVQLCEVAARLTDGVMIFGTGQELLWANAAVLRLHGVSSPEALGATITDYNMRFQARFYRDDAAHEAPDGDVLMDILLPEAGIATARTFRVRSLRLTDAQGAGAGTAMILCPVASAAAALLEAAGRLGLPALMVQDGGLVTACNTVFTQLNPAGTQPGFRRGGSRLEQLPALAACAREIAEQTAQGMETSARTVMMHDAAGKPRATVSLALRDNDAGLSAVLLLPAGAAPGAGSGVTPAEQALASLFAQLPAPALAVSVEDGRIAGANAAFAKATGHDPAALADAHADHVLVLETREQRRRFDTALQSPGGVSALDIRLRTVEGRPIDAVAAGPMFMFGGRQCLLLAMQDVSARRRDEAQLFAALQMVMQDTAWFSHAVIEKLAAVRVPAPSGRRIPAVSELTPRERDVLGLISHGMSDSDIAERLGLTRSTVRNHVATLYSKIDVHSRSSAIVWARERGINLVCAETAILPRVARPGARGMPIPGAGKAEPAVSGKFDAPGSGKFGPGGTGLFHGKLSGSALCR